MGTNINGVTIQRIEKYVNTSKTSQKLKLAFIID